ncbi:MAG: hypothetical protein ACP5FZ_01640 [Fidelibacterota bacterium]
MVGPINIRPVSRSTQVIALLLTAVLISGCADLSESENDYTSVYFPLQEGNTWYYRHSNPETENLIIRTISDSFKRDEKHYYCWTHTGNSDLHYDIRADKNGNIRLLSDSEEYLWFDFSRDSGSTYLFAPDVLFGETAYHYTAHVLSRNRTIEVPAGKFDSCITFLFDIPQIVDEEIYYVFAPNVGAILIGYDGWFSLALTKAFVNGNHIGAWE